MKSRAWYIKFPQDAYALGPVRFAQPVGESRVREWTRKWEFGMEHFKGKRLPTGFQCWPADGTVVRS
ncbi:MAG: hypothetical protein ABFE07_28205 [Armatimonadia bacterium]